MIKQLLRELAAEHVRLRRTGDQISVFSDKETLDPALIEALRAHKSELLEMIGNDGDGWWDPPAVITPDMLPLVALTQDQIDRIVGSVPGGVANVQDIYPLAPLQEGILFHHLMAKDGDAYLLPTLYAFEDRQRLDAYLGALQAVVDRHDILRTAVMWDGLPEPVQVVHRHAPLAVEEVVLDDQPGNKAIELYERFNPRHTRVDLHRAPMMRIHIAYDRAENRWLLLLLLHHLVGDHTTMDRMQDEIRAHMLGQAAALPAPLPFRNFVAQGRLGISREEHDRRLSEWLPSESDRAFVRSLMQRVTEPGKIAGWIAPPDRGINNLPVEYEYVRLQ